MTDNPLALAPEQWQRLAAARQAYNEAVREYNAAQQAFPAVMFASTLGFKPAPPLDRP